MTIVQRSLLGTASDKNIIRLITISGADETATVIYDNSALVNDVTKGNLMKCEISGSDALVSLAWDQNTDSTILTANPINSPKFNFRKIGGIPNPKGTGATGDIVVTTAGIGSGDAVTILIEVIQN